MDRPKKLRLFPLFALLLFTLVFAFSCTRGNWDGDDETDDESDQGPQPLSLTLLHTNDTHAHIEQYDSYGSSCDEADGDGCFGGVSRRATRIKQALSVSENVLFLDAGDQFQGTLYYTYFKQEVIETFMTELGYDAMTLGNHEFDDGPEVLGEFLQAIRFPVVCSNLDVSLEPYMQGQVEPYLVYEIEGERVGIVGYITEETSFLSSPGPNVKFLPEIASVRSAVEDLEAQGINKIIALSHCGYNCDQEVGAAVDGLDVIIGGHTHTLLSDTDPDAAGPYPTVVESPNGDPVLVVTAYQWGQYLGNLRVDFDEAGLPINWEGAPILLDETFEQDREVLDVVSVYKNQLDTFANEVVGKTDIDLDGSEDSCRFGECNLGDLMTDMMVWELTDQDISIAVLNSGTIRTSVPQGEITVGQVMEIAPFGNCLATMKLAGADLRAALEHSVSRAEDPGNDGTGRFLQVSGIRFTWDPDQPVGSRIVSVEVDKGDGYYEALDDETVYNIACTDYLREGGDDYTIFKDKAIDPYDFGPLLNDVIIDYLKVFSPVHPQTEGRIN